MVPWTQRVIVSGLWLCLTSSLVGQTPALPEYSNVPETLRPWIPWVMWDEDTLHSPPPFNDPSQRIAHWPSRLQLQVEANGGAWEVQVRVFDDTWVAIPGHAEQWPLSVLADDKPIVAVQHGGVPSVRLTAGEHRLKGRLKWDAMPQRLSIPRNYGMLDLSVDGQQVPSPNWDADGWLWLKRSQASEAEKDQFTVQIFRVIEDGSPIWLRTQIDISVSGKSREEEIGFVLPEQWQLSFVASPIPVAIDESGRLKAQLRPGNWQIRIDAFRNQDLLQLRYAEGVLPAVSSELIAIRAKPEFRTAELQGATPIDVQLTNFPQAWRDLSVFEWKTESTLPWAEKTRGMGLQQPDDLGIVRKLWLDDDGRGLTFQDTIHGQPKQIARLDVAIEHELGVVRIDGQRQLITQNPNSGAPGVELRTRTPTIEAIGRTTRVDQLSATGWQTDADSLHMTLYLPPGWRALVVLGADNVVGDWIRAWNLLDLFLLLIFTLAVFRIWGWIPALVAFLAFGLSYHEIGSPRLTWFFLLIPIAILRVVPEGKHVAWIRTWKGIAVAALLLNFLPFAAFQIQNSIYPQLEPVGIPYRSRTMFQWLNATYNSSADVASSAMEDQRPMYMEIEQFHKNNSLTDSLAGRGDNVATARSKAQAQSQVANMQFEAGTSIQTGIARPNWYGNQVLCEWSGPVSAAQSIQPILISCNQHRILTLVRMILLAGLLAILFRSRERPSAWRKPASPPVVASVSVLLLWVGCTSPLMAQVPDAETLRILRERMLETSDAFPNAAEIPTMSLAITEGALSLDAEVHAATGVAVPVPGKLPAWSPIRVAIDGTEAIVCRREDGYLWVWVPQGVHRIHVDGILGDSTEWVWSFALAPRHLSVDATDWNVTGLGAEGRPESQMFFVRKEQISAGSASYDQRNFRSIAVVDRVLEVGLVWRIHNTIRRLSSPGKAMSLQIPLLPGERVLTSNLIINNGAIEVNLGADASTFQWESELGRQPELVLASKPSSQTVERWSVISSPVWNIGFEGLQPIYEANREELVPVWQPWPGEQVVLKFRKPIAVPGKTLTIKELTHALAVGNRHRNSTLHLAVESSLGGDFAVEIEGVGTIDKLQLDGRPLPVRMQSDACIIPLQPGLQSIEIGWTSAISMESIVRLPSIHLPTEAANASLPMSVPESRWILWAEGPIRGPAVRFWIILAIAISTSIALGLCTATPLRMFEWVLLAIGLTQVHAAAALVVVAWLFAIGWRGRTCPIAMRRMLVVGIPLGMIALMLAAIGVLIVAVGNGLLGSPKMFIVGNGSFGGELIWYEPVSGSQLSQPWVMSVSIWYYRVLMLLWALWIANALLRWLQSWWTAMNVGGFWMSGRMTEVVVASTDPTVPPVL